MENSLPSKKQLCLIYKAILKALIKSNGVKHSWLAIEIGMRSDTFSKWYKNYERTFSLEETKLFCFALKISVDTIETLLSETIRFKSKSVSVLEYTTIKSNDTSSNKILLQFGNEGLIKLLLLIDENINMSLEKDKSFANSFELKQF